jgi:hypothetical protein
MTFVSNVAGAAEASTVTLLAVNRFMVFEAIQKDICETEIGRWTKGNVCSVIWPFPVSMQAREAIEMKFCFTMAMISCKFVKAQCSWNVVPNTAPILETTSEIVFAVHMSVL